jgi:hypothetical protein
MAATRNRAHDAKARARQARAAVLANRQAQDERIEDAAAVALLAIEDRAAAQAEAEHQERTLAAALQKLSLEGVIVRDTMTMTGLSEKYVTRLLRMQLNAATDSDSDTDDTDDTDDTEYRDDNNQALLESASAARVDVGVEADLAAG